MNESSSARLGGSQQLEIPNSKQTQSLGPDFPDGRIALAPIFLIRAEILTSAYILDIRLYFGHSPIFWTSAYILEIRLCFGHPPIFWRSAYILEIRLYFEKTPTF